MIMNCEYFIKDNDKDKNSDSDEDDELDDFLDIELTEEEKWLEM